MLAEAWGRRSQARLHVGEADRVSFGRMRAEDGMVDVPEVAALCDLRIVVQIREIGDRARIDAGGLEAGGEGGGALRAGPFLEPCLERVDGGQPPGPRGELPLDRP